MSSATPMTMSTRPAPLSAQQRRWLDAAWARLNRDRLAALITDLVNIPSPTGSEGPAAKYAVAAMRADGLDAYYQEMSPNRGNAVGRVHGTGTGPSLLLYGHLDHYITGDADDALVTGGLEHPAFRSVAVRDGDVISGAGAGNPKAGSVAAMLAAEAVAGAGVPLTGDVVLGIVSGGIHKVQMPRAGRPYVGEKYEGMAAGVAYMLRHGVRADYCISTKPGYSVVWEEPGVAWIKLTVKGVVGYVSRRGVYKRAIADAAPLITALEDWFEAYAERHASAQAGSPGHIGAIEGGWPFKPDFSPGVCNLYLDIRVAPHMDALDTLREFDAFIAGYGHAHPGVTLAWEPFSTIPGTSTDPGNWIVQSSMRAWETVEGKPHKARVGMSGMTDAAILRTAGIPTARLGGELTRGRDASLGFLGGEGADLDVMLRVAKCYAYAIIDTCTRTREEIARQA